MFIFLQHTIASATRACGVVICEGENYTLVRKETQSHDTCQRKCFKLAVKPEANWKIYVWS